MPQSTAERLKTYRDSLLTELENGPTKPSYSIDGQSVDWNGYRVHLLNMIREVEATIAQLEPFEIRTTML